MSKATPEARRKPPAMSVATGRTKVGCFLGDHTKSGLGALLNTGTHAGAFCNLLPTGGYLPKYVPSTTLEDPGWNSHVLRGDIEAGIRELKAQPGRELQVHGSGELLRWLLERDLVDELNLELYPVVVGEGRRLFPDSGHTHALELVDSQTTPTGVTLQTYRLAGRATFGTVGE